MKLVKIVTFFPLILLILSSVSGSIHLAPNMTKSPTDLTYVLGSTGNELIWAFDAHESADSPSKYVVSVNDVVLPAHNFVAWQDNVDIVVGVDGFEVGSYVVKIIANDTGTDTGQAPSKTDIANVIVVTKIVSTTPNTSNASAFPITFVSLIIALAIGIPVFKYRKYER